MKSSLKGAERRCAKQKGDLNLQCIYDNPISGLFSSRLHLGPPSPGSFRAGFQGGSHRSLWPGAGGALTQSKFLQELGPLYCAPGSDQSASPWRSVGEFCLVSQRKKEQHKTKRWCDMKGLW